MFNTFKNEWLGKRVDFDASYGYQCVDLIRQWLKEAEGVSNTGGVSYAYQYWTNTPQGVSAVVDKISYPTTLQAGDILPLTDASGRETALSHIMIATGNTYGGMFEGLEQNGSTGGGSGTGGDAIRYRYVTTSRILGVLRPKTAAPAPTPAAAQSGQRLYLPAVPSWRIYPENGAYTIGHEVGKLAPAKFGGLQYVIVRWAAPNIAIIDTHDFGRVGIYVGADTGAVIQ